MKRLTALLGAMVMTCASSLAVPTQAVPPGWQPETAIAGTADTENHVGASSPQGSDFVAWPSGPITNLPGESITPAIEISGKFRKPGTLAWVTVPRLSHPMINRFSLSIESNPSGKFWVTWVSGAVNEERIFLAVFNPANSSWTAPAPVFQANAAYRFLEPSLAVSEKGDVAVGGLAIPTANVSLRRAVVARQLIGGAWREWFLTPSTSVSFQSPAVAIDQRGHIAAGWAQGANPGAPWRGVLQRSATTWNIQEIGPSATDGTQEIHDIAIGRDGTVAMVYLVWSGTTIMKVKLARGSVLTPSQAWTASQLNAADSGQLTNVAHVEVAHGGAIYGAWEQVEPQLNAHVVRTAAGIAGPVTEVRDPATTSTRLHELRVRNDGKVGILTQTNAYDESVPAFYTTLSYVIFDGTNAGFSHVDLEAPVQANLGMLGHNAANEPTVINSRYPASHGLTWAGPIMKLPRALTSAYSGTAAATAIKGRMRVGRTVACSSGFWVEATALKYKWTRNGVSIRGATGSKRTLTRQDRGKYLRCQVTATQTGGSTIKLSPRRRVR